MKVKVLLVPLFITISIALVIWFVYPAVTNGTDGLKETYEQLQKEKKLVSELDVKSQNVQKLMAQIASGTEEKNTLFQFLPEDAKEEEIIDNLNFLAGNNELPVIDLSVTQPKKEELSPEMTEAIVEVGSDLPVQSSGAENLLDAGTGIAKVIPAPVAKNLEVSFSVIGSYDKMKALLDKVGKLERFNKIETLEIKRPDGEGVPADLLQMKAVLTFNFFKKKAVLSDIENKVFGLAQFDMGAISDIKNSRSVDVLKLNIEQSGKANPFLP